MLLGADVAVDMSEEDGADVVAFVLWNEVGDSPLLVKLSDGEILDVFDGSREILADVRSGGLVDGDERMVERRFNKVLLNEEVVAIVDKVVAFYGGVPFCNSSLEMRVVIETLEVVLAAIRGMGVFTQSSSSVNSPRAFP